MTTRVPVLSKRFQKDRHNLRSGHKANFNKINEILTGLSLGDEPEEWTLRPESRLKSCVKFELHDGYRAVFQRTVDGAAYLGLAIGKHDDIESFLDSHRGWIFDRNGKAIEISLEVVPDTEVAVAPSSQLRPVGLGDTVGEAASSQKLDEVADEILLALGLSEAEVSRLRGIPDLNSLGFQQLLDDIGAREVNPAEHLLVLATGSSDQRAALVALARGEADVVVELTAASADVMSRDTERFLSFNDPKGLEDFLAGDRFLDWQLFLHPDQVDLARAQFEGPARVRGISGSGKTVVALHRARALARSLVGTKKWVLFTTFNKALAQEAGKLLDSLCSPDERARIEVSHLHKWCGEFLVFRSHPKPRFDLKQRDEIRKLLEQKIKMHEPDILDLREYLWDEIDFILGRFLNEDRAAYLDTDRSGRGRGLSRRQREAVLRVYDEYMIELAKRRIQDPAELVRLACRRRRDGDLTERDYATVIVDEVQDFSELALQLVALLPVARRNNLLLVGDGTQRIFTRGFSMKGLGIDISGRSFVLRKNYRNTKEILEAAFPLIADEWREEVGEHGSPAQVLPEFSAREGSRPALVSCMSESAEDRFLVDEIRYLLRTGTYRPSQICVMGRTEPLRGRILKALSVAGIGVIDYKAEQNDYASDEEKVRISSLHAAKGHEYGVVLIPGLVENVLPPRFASGAEAIVAERALLYVGMTRARDLLYLSFPQYNNRLEAQKRSRFVDRIERYCDLLQGPPAAT